MMVEDLRPRSAHWTVQHAMRCHRAPAEALRAYIAMKDPREISPPWA